MPGRLPADPAAFVAAAERAVNTRDVEAWCAAYAPGITLDATTDGAHEQHVGAAAARVAVTGYLAGMQATGFRLAKTLVVAGDGVLVNRWTSDFRGRRRGHGIETWHFDAAGLVDRHEMLTFFDVRPSQSVVARARLGLAYPRIALAFLKATRG